MVQIVSGGLWHRIAIALASIACLFCSGCSILADLAPVKEEVVAVQNWLVVPIFYATNRERADSLQIDFVEKKNSGKLLFGVKNVVIPCPGDLSPELIESMGWRLLHLDAPIRSDVRPLLPADNDYKILDKELLSTEIVGAFDRYRHQFANEDAVLFVHGCCATFKTNMERAAKLTAQMRLPVVVYDWVSPIGFTHYLENEVLAQQTYDGFCNFLDNVAKYIPPKRTILIGHSLGAAFIDEAFVRRYERSFAGKSLNKYQEIVLSQPDLDAITYINHNKNIASQANKTRIFLVMDDPRLRVSAIAHGGYERLGRPTKLLDKLCQIDNQDIIDMTVTGMGHNLPAKFIANIHNSGKIDDPAYQLVEKTPHLFVFEKSGEN